MTSKLDALSGGIVVSCQAEDSTPTNTPAMIVAFAQSAQMGGAVGLRLASAEHIAAVRAEVSLPVIGIHKYYDKGGVIITGKPEQVPPLVAAGAEIIAFDASMERDEGILREIVATAHDLGALALADLRRFDDAERAAALGVDALATTLSVLDMPEYHADVELVQRLAAAYALPVIAEGNYWTPGDVRRAFDAGAHAVVIGSAITRPWLITAYFVRGAKND